MTPPATLWNVRWLGWMALLLLVPALFIQIQRGHSALSISLPTATTGSEEESFYAIWRVNHALATYPDPRQPPYAATYFNWLFYRAYSATSASYPDEQIPHRGRILTLIGAAAALGLSGWALALGGPARRWHWGALAAVALFSSSLFGWWLVTVRPDVWALAFELGATVWFLTLQARRRWLAVLGAVALAYVAWSFKQANVSVIGTLIGFLLWRRERGSAAVAAGLFAFLVTVTLLLGGPLYRMSLLSAAAGIDVPSGWANLQGAVVRALPIAVLPIYTLGRWLGDGRKPWSSETSPTVQFATIGMVLSGFLAFASGFKAGASHNYYFTTACFATLAGVHSRFGLQSRAYRQVGDAVVAAALVAACLLASLQAVGRIGSLSLAAADAELTQRLDAWNRLPAPRFSVDRRVALPWLNPGSPLFLPANNYAADRRRRLPFAHDGIGGLIAEGYFASLLLPADSGDYFDGAQLSDHYRRTSNVAGLAVFERVAPRSPP